MLVSNFRMLLPKKATDHQWQYSPGYPELPQPILTNSQWMFWGQFLKGGDGKKLLKAALKKIGGHEDLACKLTTAGQLDCRPADQMTKLLSAYKQVLPTKVDKHYPVKDTTSFIYDPKQPLVQLMVDQTKPLLIDYNNLSIEEPTDDKPKKFSYWLDLGYYLALQAMGVDLWAAPQDEYTPVAMMFGKIVVGVIMPCRPRKWENKNG